MTIKVPNAMDRATSRLGFFTSAAVKIFWMSLPSRTPSVFRNVRKTIINTPTSCCTERLIAYFEDSAIGGTIQVVGEIDGNNPPRYRANPTATAAIVPV